MADDECQNRKEKGGLRFVPILPLHNTLAFFNDNDRLLIKFTCMQ